VRVCVCVCGCVCVGVCAWLAWGGAEKTAVAFCQQKKAVNKYQPGTFQQ
jgi:hypothetical protein